ncbi:MAG: YbaK/EbsC family protein [Bacillota bacterium]|nr:YbaK/EbsC family protein [Bacillota bacterium]HHU60522.1 YbaK/EbsC family protein [Natronincola sp.]
MSNNLKGSAEKVQRALEEKGLELEVVEFAESTRTVKDAASAIGCKVEQIAKSLIFKGEKSQKPILVIASGPNRVNEKAMHKVIGEKLDRADANWVSEITGFSIGGIPPFAHNVAIDTYIDEDLFLNSEIWAAAGTPNSVFKLSPKNLLTLTEGKVVSVK